MSITTHTDETGRIVRIEVGEPIPLPGGGVGWMVSDAVMQGMDPNTRVLMEETLEAAGATSLSRSSAMPGVWVYTRDD